MSTKIKYIARGDGDDYYFEGNSLDDLLQVMSMDGFEFDGYFSELTIFKCEEIDVQYVRTEKLVLVKPKAEPKKTVPKSPKKVSPKQPSK